MVVGSKKNYLYYRFFCLLLLHQFLHKMYLEPSVLGRIEDQKFEEQKLKPSKRSFLRLGCHSEFRN